MFKLLCIAICVFMSACAHLESPLSLQQQKDLFAKYKEANSWWEQQRVFDSTSAVVIKFLWKEITMMGYASVDLVNDNFRAVAMNPMGAKIFDVSGSEQGYKLNYVFDSLKKIPNIERYAGQDIEKIYLDQLVAEELEFLFTSKYDLVIAKNGKNKVKYYFSKVDSALYKKVYYKGLRKESTVLYRDYKEYKAGIFPGQVLIKNHRLRYSLEVNHKEVEMGENESITGKA